MYGMTTVIMYGHQTSVVVCRHQHNVFVSLEDSRSVWKDVECKLRCVNFRRVSDPRRAFQPTFRVTAISDHWNRSPMGVSVIGSGTPQSAGENFKCTWDHLGALAASLRALTTSLGAPRITVEKSGKHNIFFENAACVPRNHCYYRSCNDFNTRLFSLYSHLCIYVSI